MGDTGFVKIEKVRGKSCVTECFSKYPLKFIIPTKAGSIKADAIWIYMLTYGGGIVSVYYSCAGDYISFSINVEEGCNTVLTTQASTKVYKSDGINWSKQCLEAKVGRSALLAVLPDPVTCFSLARYSQKQVFRAFIDSNLILVDWLTSGRHGNGEKWDFEFYRSTSHIYLEADQPLFLDSVFLEQGMNPSNARCLFDFQVIGMMVLMGPKLKEAQDMIKDNVKQMMFEQFHALGHPNSGSFNKFTAHSGTPKPTFIASCSSFGPEEEFEM